MNKKAYLTKRVLERAIGPAIRRASQEAMATVGYMIVAENGWVVKADRDGNRTQLSKIKQSDSPLVLD